jgi:transposase
MAHKEKEQQARGLFVRGYSTNEVAAELAVNIRTVQRWYKQWKIEQGLVDPPTNIKAKAKPTAIVKVDPEVVEQIQSATAEPKLLGFNGTYQEWNLAITNKFTELSKFHEKERLRHQSILDQKQRDANGDPASRDCNALSQAMTRHSEQEVKMLCMGRTDLLNYSQGYAMFNAGGYGVYKKQSESENETFSQSGSASENRDENPEGDSTT